MKVLDIMQKHVDFVTKDATVREVARLIFGHGINGLPVCEGKRVVGFITERDILRKFYPSMQEYVEDPVHTADFEGMEKNVSEILNMPAEEIMNKQVLSIEAKNPILRAQSSMLVYRVNRLPVVDKNENLVGIITQGDIFRALVGKQMPYVESEEYHDWIAKHYDLAIDWKSRLPFEIPTLTNLFKKHGVTHILDIDCGIGEHAIELAKKGFFVVGMENSMLMLKQAEAKWKKLSKPVQNRVKFVQGDYVSNLKKIKDRFGAAIFMGNSFAHLPDTLKDVLKELDRILLPKALIIAQLINFNKALKDDNRVVMFHIKQSKLSKEWQHSYLWFYSTPKKRDDSLVLNAAIFDFNGKIWTARGTNSVKTARLNKGDIQNLLKKIRFNKISFYGTNKWGNILKNTFNPLEHDWFNVMAER